MIRGSCRYIWLQKLLPERALQIPCLPGYLKYSKFREVYVKLVDHPLQNMCLARNG